MKTSIGKRTVKTTSVTWSGILSTDDGTRIASLNATLDRSHPRGTTNMVVVSQEIFNQYKDEVTAAYDSFMEQVREAADSTTLVTDETEGTETPPSTDMGQVSII